MPQSPGRPGSRRCAGRVAAAVLASLTLLPAGTGHATEHLVEVPIGGFCADAPPPPFTDVAESATFRTYIGCLADAGLTLGTAGGTIYGPGGLVTRAQMATFVARLLETANELEVTDGATVALPAYEGPGVFVDVPRSSAHWESIHRLQAAGIALGGPDGRPDDRYDPGGSVTRAQAVSLIVRALEHLIDEEVVSQERDYFADVAGGPHAVAIDVVAELGIAIGDETERFGPGLPLNRGQIAAFLVRSLAVLELSDYVTPPPG